MREEGGGRREEGRGTREEEGGTRDEVQYVRVHCLLKEVQSG